MKHVSLSSEVMVIGGGPAGASIARLLAMRGHTVTVASRRIDDRCGIAESLPPSTRKVMAAVGILDAVEQSRACRNVGNAVWWGSDEGRIEDFRAPESGSGLQIWRPDFDRLLAAEAMAAGAIWKTGNVTGVRFTDDRVETTIAGRDGGAERVVSTFVVDASGRSGVLGRSSRQPIAGRRTHAWIGCWSHPPATGLAGDTRTLVETTHDSWVWSVPVSTDARCVTVMVDPARTRFASTGGLERRYLAELTKTRHIAPLLADASLRRVWGCDASLYETADLGGPRHLVIGDAASFIDPLSSFGVKKALTSAWMGAAVVHTCLIDPTMDAAARGLFAVREREAYGSSVRASADYARQAAAHHDSDFWRARAAVPAALCADRVNDTGPATDDDVARAFADLCTRPAVSLRPAADVRFEWQPAFHRDCVALERAVSTDRLTRPIRFVDNVDLTCLVDIAPGHSQVGDLFSGYCRRAAPVPLPNFLRALSVLVATRVLEPADC